MELYIKDGKVYKTPIKLKIDKVVKVKKDDKEVEKMVKVDCWTNDQSLILENGFTEYIYTTKQLTKQDYRYNKRKIKNKLVELGYWSLIKENLTEDEYQNLILSEDFAFDDELFVKCYNMLKDKIENIDDLLTQCRK